MRFAFAMLAATLLACSDPAAPQPGSLIGHWLTEPQPLLPSGSHQYSLRYGADGRYTSEVRSYGLYAGQAATDLSAYVQLTGTFRAEAGRIAYATERIVRWDHFYGPESAPVVQEPAGAPPRPDDGTQYEIRGDRLTLHYLSYPLDAPVPTTQVYFRAD